MGLFSDTYFTVTCDHLPMRAFAGNDNHIGTDASVHDKTGVHVQVLDHMWKKASPHLKFRPKKKKDKTKAYFFLIFVMIHLHPTARNIKHTLYTPQTSWISESTWRRILKPMLAKIASMVDEIHWGNCLHKDNHSLFFPKGVTGIIDCAPVRVVKPVRR